jgi:hypothetical protein
MDLFDIVIPLGSNDVSIIKEQISHTKKNVIGFRNIYIVTNEEIDFDDKNVIIIKEFFFPFCIENISKMRCNSQRSCWYLQQLIKLYSGFVITGILTRYLVIDADTFFLKPTTFVSNDNCLFNFGTENHRPYFTHMSKLHPSFDKQINLSGICHHMIFDTTVIRRMFDIVEEYHNQPFWVSFINLVDKNDYEFSGASEYELYFNFVIKFTENYIVRELKWKNVSYPYKNVDDKLSYVSCHHYMRDSISDL